MRPDRAPQRRPCQNLTPRRPSAKGDPGRSPSGLSDLARAARTRARPGSCTDSLIEPTGRPARPGGDRVGTRCRSRRVGGVGRRSCRRRPRRRSSTSDSSSIRPDRPDRASRRAAPAIDQATTPQRPVEAGRDGRSGRQPRQRAIGDGRRTLRERRDRRSSETSPTRPLSAPDDQHVPREPRQALDPAGAGVEQDEVLDPDARLALEVDPGLDREDRRRRQRRVRRRAAQRRPLVRRQSDPVAQPVAVRPASGRPPR